MDESDTNEAECRRRIAIGRKVSGTIRSLVKSRGLQIECARVLYEILILPVLMYGSEPMKWKDKERSKIRVL